MIFLRADEDGRVNSYFMQPFDEIDGLHKTKEELEQDGILVDSLPKPVQQEGKRAVLYVNSAGGTAELYYQYVDIPPTPEDKLARLEAELAQFKVELTATQDATDFILFNQMPLI